MGIDTALDNRLDYVFTGSKPSGLQYGYHVFGNSMRKELLSQGMVFNKQATIRMEITSPDYFQPVFTPQKRNILFTMWESDIFPRVWLRRLNSADQLIVPCHHNRDILLKYFKKGDVEICPLGYDPSIYQYHHHIFESDKTKFRILWLGSPNIRKGFDVLTDAFARAFKVYEPVELCIKTTELEFDELPAPWQKHVKDNIWKPFPNVCLDNRNLSIDEMVKLYKSAHVFAFPSRGEGFGLPAVEAMASGCLVIAPAIQGLAEFINPDTAWVLCCNKIAAKYGEYIVAPNPDYKHLAHLLRKAYENYASTEKLRESAAKYVSENFTWTHSAKRLKEILWRENAAIV